MTRTERRALNRLAEHLSDCPGDLTARLRTPRWWESAGFARAMCSTMLFGAATVSRELGAEATSASAARAS